MRVYRSNTARGRALDRWLHLYNHHRGHTALGGDPPITQATNLAGEHSRRDNRSHYPLPQQVALVVVKSGHCAGMFGS